MIAKPPVTSDWLAPLKYKPEARVSLFCFPPAGASSLFFRPWVEQLPDWLNLWGVRLPGRESRMLETPLTRWEELIGPLLDSLLPHCAQPFAFFGHSFGALLGFELAHQLSDRHGYIPQSLILSGRQPPHLFAEQRNHQREDEQLIAELKADGSIPDVVLQNSKLVNLLLRIYKADLQLNREYTYRERGVLACPILALGGEADETVKAETLPHWQRHTAVDYRIHIFPGGHMYLIEKEKQTQVIQIMVDFLQKHSSF